MLKLLVTGLGALLWASAASAACGTDLPYTAQARADVAAMGYTCEILADSFTALSTIDLVQNAQPYSAGYNWYSVGPWPRVASCNNQPFWCTSSAQNVSSGFASIVGGKVKLTQNVSTPSSYPILSSCYPTGAAPYWGGTPIPPGGYYFEVKFSSGTPTIAWTMPTEFLTAGIGATVQFVEEDNIDNGGNGRGNAAWYTTGGALETNQGIFLESPQDTITNALVAGVMAVPAADANGQTLSSGVLPVGQVILNWYNTTGFAATNAGNGATSPFTGNWITQLTNQHNCVLISGNGVGVQFGVDWVRVWTKPVSSGGTPGTGSGFRLFGTRG